MDDEFPEFNMEQGFGGLNTGTNNGERPGNDRVND